MNIFYCLLVYQLVLVRFHILVFQKEMALPSNPPSGSLPWTPVGNYRDFWPSTTHHLDHAHINYV